MKLWMVCLLLAWSCQSFAQNPFRVMVLNAEWFWTPHDGHVDGGKMSPGDPTPKAYQQELNFYRDLIRTQKVDLVALAEIEHGTVAEDLAHSIGPQWRSYFVQGRDTATGQDVAIITRLPVLAGSVTALGFPQGKLPGESKGKRLSKFLALKVKGQSGELIVLTSHMLSRRGDNPKKSLDRQRQAHAMISASNQLQTQGQPILMLGDFNSPAKSKEFAILQDGGRFRVAEQDCARNEAGKRSSVVQIFYQGLRCSDYTRIKMTGYSDHQAVLAELWWR